MNTIHKRLLKQIFFISFVAIIFGIVRFFATGYTSYLWLNWNLFLALVPVFLAWLVTNIERKWITLFVLLAWIGFLPNSPYIVTDFIHLANVGPKSALWFDAIMIFTYAFSGIVSWFLSVDIVRRHLSLKVWFVWIAAFLSGFGIYVGRFVGFNTWNLVSHPVELFEKVGAVMISPSSHFPALPMTLTFTILLSVIYISFYNILDHEKTNN